MLGIRPKAFCRICQKELYLFYRNYEGHYYCPNHYSSFLTGDWCLIETFLFHPEEEAAARLEDLRLRLLKKEKILSYSDFSYTSQEDQIYTETKVYGLKKDKEYLLSQFKKIK